MGGDPQSARVGDTVPVEQDDVRNSGEFLPRRDDGRPLPEGEVAGNVREGGPADRRTFLHDTSRRGVGDDHRRRHKVFLSDVGDVGGSDETDAVQRKRDLAHRLAEAFLDLPGLPYGGGERRDLHGAGRKIEQRLSPAVKPEPGHPPVIE